MNSVIKNIAIFTVGLAIGSAVSYIYNSKKFNAQLDDEIEKTKSYYENKYSITEESVEKDSTVEEPINVEKTEEYLKMINRYDSPAVKNDEKETNKIKATFYDPLTDEIEEVEVEGNMTNDELKPYVISPDEFGETDYKIISLNYYADKVLTDEFDNIIDDVEGTVGEASLDTFGEYEDDTVFVRNDSLEIDYEICADLRAYSEIYRNEG